MLSCKWMGSVLQMAHCVSKSQISYLSFRDRMALGTGTLLAVHSTWIPFWEVELKGFLPK